jgi:hypothetical protein
VKRTLGVKEIARQTLFIPIFSDWNQSYRDIWSFCWLG